MTLFGNHTAAETGDLIRDKDALIQALADGFSSLPFPAVTDTAWNDDFAALRARYTQAKAGFSVELSTEQALAPLASLNVLTTETTYQAILRALQATEGVTAPTDAQGLYDRLAAMRTAVGLAAIDEHAVQPTAPDADLTALHAATAATDAIDAAGKKATAVLSSHKTLLLGALGAAGLLVGTYVFAKVT